MMKGKEYLSNYCQDHNGEEIYEFLKNLFDRSLGYTDSRLYIVEWLDKDISINDYLSIIKWLNKDIYLNIIKEGEE